MIGHPVVEAAAVALLRGWDPVAYARADGVERSFADAVLRRAQELYAEEAEGLAKAIGYYVAKAMPA